MDEELLSEGIRVTDLLRGHMITQIVASGVRLGIFDLIGDQLVTEDDISAFTGVNLAELRLLLDALVALRLLNLESGHYSGTVAARNLRSDSGNLYGQALMAGAEYYDAWRELDFSLRTGESGFQHRHGRSLWESFDNDSEVTASFMRTMRWNTEKALDEILGLFTFPETGVIADLGAGDGSLMGSLLLRMPGIRAIVIDLPSTINVSRRTLAGLGVESRCEFIPGNLFEEIPVGANLYILKSVVHNWKDESAIRILQNCRNAMSGDSRLLLIERVISDLDPLGSAVRNLTMLVLFGSHERTVQDYEALVGRAGFEIGSVRTGPTGIMTLEAFP